MKIVGVLSWYDESPHWLATAVAGFGRLCDSIIAVDGAYALFPGARPRSHPQQAEAIVQAADAAECGLILHRPDDIWYGNEVEKRNFSLKLAGNILEEGEDWLLVFDADYHMLMCNPEMIRAELAQTDLNVATYTILDGIDFLGDEALGKYAATVDSIDHEWTCRTRDIYRWNPSIKIGPAHWTYSALVDGKRRWLRGPWEKEVDALELDRNLVVYHRTQDRVSGRRERAKRYYDTRMEQKTEWMESYEPA
jgi:hypothetical protein